MKIKESNCSGVIEPYLLSYYNKCLLLLKHAANSHEMERKSLLSELEVLKTLKPHPHVIKLLGCVTVSGISYKRLKKFPRLQVIPLG